LKPSSIPSSSIIIYYKKACRTSEPLGSSFSSPYECAEAAKINPACTGREIMWRVKEYWKYGCMCCYEQCPADPSNYYTDNNWDIYEYEECEIPWVNPSLQPSSIPSLQPSPSCLPVTVEVWPDCCPEDISWEVIDANGKLVFVGDGAEDGFMSSLWSQTTCLAVGSYSFIFSDSSWRFICRCLVQSACWE